MDVDENDDLPAGLKAALRGLYPTPRVPQPVDDAVLRQAGWRFAALRRWRPIYRIAASTAAAAVVLLAVTLALHRSQPRPAPVAANPRDLNGDGTVDIRDALYLAQHVASKQTRAEWDFDGSGQVDRKDADAIAISAVKL
jgi:hypothetical protein